MRQGQKVLPAKGIQKVFPAPVSSPPSPKIPVRARAEFSRAAFHSLCFFSSSGLQSSRHQHCRDSPMERSNQKSPSRWEEGAPWAGLAAPAPLPHQNHPPGHPSLLQCQGKGTQGPCSKAHFLKSSICSASGLQLGAVPTQHPQSSRDLSKNRASLRHLSNSS